MIRSTPGGARRLLVALLLLPWLAAACSAGAGDSASAPIGGPTAPSVSPSPAEPASDAGQTSGAASLTPTGTPPAIRRGTVAATARVRFVPALIELPSGDTAVIEPVRTIDGVLQVPADVGHVGWWDGSADAGDPFGSTVIAGHVDSREQGLGFFAQLLVIRVGDTVTLRSGTDALTYRVVSTSLVNKQALASDGQAFDQHGPHRLVLLTCSGQWHAELRSYESNLVVVADPVVA